MTENPSLSSTSVVHDFQTYSQSAQIPLKPAFPLHSLGLGFFLISDYFSNGSGDVREKVRSYFPFFESLESAHIQILSTNVFAPITEKLQTYLGLITQNSGPAYTPDLEPALTSLFVHVYGMQEKALAVIGDAFNQQHITRHDLTLFIGSRAGEAQVVAEVIARQIQQGQRVLSIQERVVLHALVASVYQLEEIASVLEVSSISATEEISMVNLILASQLSKEDLMAFLKKETYIILESVVSTIEETPEGFLLKKFFYELSKQVLELYSEE